MEKLRRKNKSLLLIEGLSRREYISFNKFLKFSLQDTNHNVYKFWCDINQNDSDLEKISQITDKYSRKVQSDFNKILEDYYFYKSLKSDKLVKMSGTLKEVRYRNLFHIFNLMLNDNQEIKNYAQKETLGLGNSLKILMEKYWLYNTYSNEDKMILTAQDMQEVGEKLYWQMILFSYLNENVYKSENFKSNNNIEIDIIKSRIKDELVFIKSNYCNLYILYLLMDLSEKFTKENFIIVKNEIFRKRKNVSNEFFQFAYQIIFRILVINMNVYSGGLLTFAYDVLLEFKNKKIWKYSSHIQPINFLYHIYIAICNNDIKLAENLIKENHKKLNGDLKDDVLTLCNSLIELQKQNYAEVLKMLKNLKTKNITIYLFSKMTLLKAMYEHNDFKFIYPLIDALKHYLIRHKNQIEYDLNGINKFISYLNNLIHIKNGNQNYIDISEKISFENEFIGKNWIEQQIEIHQPLIF